MNKAEKLDYILDNYMSAAEVIRAFGFKTSSMITNMRNGTGNIANIHIEALELHFDIPIYVFNYKIITTKEIDKLIKEFKLQKKRKQKEEKLQKNILKTLENLELLPQNIFKTNFTEKETLTKCIEQYKEKLIQKDISSHREQFSNKIFPKNEKLFEKIKGVWYGYVYPSNPASSEHGIWEVKTTIGEDYSVIDKWGNAGYLKLGKNESLIIKESYEHDDLTIIRFSNRQVSSGHFRFVIVANQNHTLNEIVNFGFFSRIPYTPNEAKEILGDKDSKQLKLDLTFNERLIEKTIVPE